MQKTQIPTAFLKDFHVFMDYLQKHDVKFTKTKKQIGLKYLPEINQLLSIKLDGIRKNAGQNFYPTIDFLFSIALTANFIRIASKEIKVTSNWEWFQTLNEVEQYFVLLETVWIDLDWNLSHERASATFYDIIDDVGFECSNAIISQKKLKIEELLVDDNIWYLYFEWMGFWNTENEDIAHNMRDFQPRKVYHSLTMTDFGKHLLTILYTKRNIEYWNKPLMAQEGIWNPIPGIMDQSDEYEPFINAFKPLFPNDLHQSLARDLTLAFQEGQHLFHIYYSDDIWADVCLPADYTLEHLHDAIMQAFDMLDDHLYSFFLDNKRWSSKQEISCPFDVMNPFHTDEISIGELALKKGQPFLYVYDFGAETTFQISFKGIDNTCEVGILDKNGTLEY
ncbi:IS1096 element passenger TnpR family protein [Gracilibacillus massiliensis]|uniref:IS1096 element passenger TnpR family protein n=1 Tax=Gracilibacillus massiliensis TaxID=1564956 RepID=UPI00071E25AE|nr:hypothetical protein [Gracilibacillus massiliensis]